MDITRDLRVKTQYKIDDEYLNGYARLCGVFATAVYNSLSRHANYNTQKCFPAIKTIAEQHKISRPSVIKGIKVLEKWNIIKIIKSKDKESGRQKPNEYVLLDKSQWKNKPRVNNIDTGLSESRVNENTKPSQSQNKSRVNEVDHKDNKVLRITNIKEDVAKATPFTNKELLGYINKSLEDKRKHIRIIGQYIATKSFGLTNTGSPLEFGSKEEVGAFFKRNLKAASNLKPYSEEKIKETMDILQEYAKDFLWTLETVGKKINLGRSELIKSLTKNGKNPT